MSWFIYMLMSHAQQNMNRTKASGILDAIGAGIGVIGGALTGAAVGAVFGPAGIAIVIYAGAYIGSEGAMACVRAAKDILSKS